MCVCLFLRFELSFLLKFHFLGLFQEPQHESKDKKMKLFNSGSVSMDVSLEKTGFFQGGALKLTLALLVSLQHKVGGPTVGMCLRRRGVEGPGLHSEQLLARDQAQVLPVPKTLLLCRRQ